MKRFFVVFAVLMILLLSSCSKTNKLFEINHEHYYSSKNLEFVTEKEGYSSSDTVIRYYITNTGEEENAIAADSECFELHRLVDGEWMEIGAKIDHAWTEAALILEPGKTVTREIDLEKYFYLPLEAGEYRISVGYLLSESFTVS